jgi:hypothetical protein
MTMRKVRSCRSFGNANWMRRCSQPTLGTQLRRVDLIPRSVCGITAPNSWRLPVHRAVLEFRASCRAKIEFTSRARAECYLGS